MKRAIGIFALTLQIGLGVQPVFSQEGMIFQGYLTDGEGAPVSDGTHAVRFQLFDEAKGGSLLWEESHIVTTHDGVFSSLIGSEALINLEHFDRPPFLQLTIEEAILYPRTPLLVVSNAIKRSRPNEEARVTGEHMPITQPKRSPFEREVAKVSGGLMQVATDATLSGDGTTEDPLGVRVPLELSGGGAYVVRGKHKKGNYGWLGSGTVGAGGVSGSGNVSYLGHEDYATWSRHYSGNSGHLGSIDYGAYGKHWSGNSGYLGGIDYSIYGEHENGTYGFLGSAKSGAYGEHANGNLGSLGSAGSGVYGKHANGNLGWIGGEDVGVFGQNNNGNLGYLGGEETGVLGLGSFYAGFFYGNVFVNGMLGKSGGSFKIDHPLDPANKYLLHSFVESPDMMNVYNGNVTTDANGEAIVTLPDYFDTLNRDFRYQLTVIGQFAQAIISEKIRGNRFVIRTDKPGVEVSWQVTGIRQDAWANEHRIIVEENKPATERGYYLHPQLFGQPEERSIEWARDPEMMRELQEQSARFKAKSQ